MKERSLPFFKFDALKWLSTSSKVQLLDHAEKGTFIDLLAMCWSENGFFKVDDFLFRKLRVDKGTLTKRLQTLLDLEIISIKNDILSVKFIDSQIQERKEFLEQAKENGKKGGRPKRVPQPKQKAESISRKKKEERKEPPISPQGEILFPDVLDTEEFKEAWTRWEKHMRELHKRITPTARDIQLINLAKEGHDRAIRIINQSFNYRKLVFDLEDDPEEEMDDFTVDLKRRIAENAGKPGPFAPVERTPEEIEEIKRINEEIKRA